MLLVLASKVKEMLQEHVHKDILVALSWYLVLVIFVITKLHKPNSNISLLKKKRVILVNEDWYNTLKTFICQNLIRQCTIYQQIGTYQYVEGGI